LSKGRKKEIDKMANHPTAADKRAEAARLRAEAQKHEAEERHAEAERLRVEAEKHEAEAAKHEAEAAARVQTVADEQRERSAEIEKVGSAAWVAAHDERTEEQKQGMAVTGVANVVVEGASKK
jgi:hypothetical protein